MPLVQPHRLLVLLPERLKLLVTAVPLLYLLQAEKGILLLTGVATPGWMVVAPSVRQMVISTLLLLPNQLKLRAVAVGMTVHLLVPLPDSHRVVTAAQANHLLVEPLRARPRICTSLGRSASPARPAGRCPSGEEEVSCAGAAAATSAGTLVEVSQPSRLVKGEQKGKVRTMGVEGGRERYTMLAAAAVAALSWAHTGGSGVCWGRFLASSPVLAVSQE